MFLGLIKTDSTRSFDASPTQTAVEQSRAFYGDSGKLRLALQAARIQVSPVERIWSEKRLSGRRLKLWNAGPVHECSPHEYDQLLIELRNQFGARFVSAKLKAKKPELVMQGESLHSFSVALLAPVEIT